ncbi:MAG: CapA family protein [Acetobacteraceae bacterium]|nr:CapA family protein [Acetobacteraceae bacterium]
MKSKRRLVMAAVVTAAALLLGSAAGFLLGLHPPALGGADYVDALDLRACAGAVVVYYHHPASGCVVPITIQPPPGRARYWPTAAALLAGPPPAVVEELGLLLPGPGPNGSPAPELRRAWVEGSTLNLLVDRLPWAGLDAGLAEGVKLALGLTFSGFGELQRLSLWHGGGPAAAFAREDLLLPGPPVKYLVLDGRSRRFLACTPCERLPAGTDPVEAVAELRRVPDAPGGGASPLPLPWAGLSGAFWIGGTLRLEFTPTWLARRRPLELDRAAADGLALSLGSLCGASSVEWGWRGSTPVGGRPSALGPNPSPLPEELARGPALELVAVGDVMLGRGIAGRMNKYGQTYPFDRVRSYLAGAGLAFANLEAALSDGGRMIPNKGIWLLASPETAPVLAGSGLDVLSLANNHILDYDSPALLQTLDVLNGAGLLGVGAGKDAEEAWRPRVVEAGGLRLGFLASTEFGDIFWSLEYPRTFAAGPGLPGVSPLDIDRLVAATRKLAEECDVVLVSLHWGVEESHRPTGEQRALAARLCGAGAQIVLGHHAHVLQGIEVIDGGVAVYSLGNFVYDQRKESNTQSMMVFFGLDRVGVGWVRVLPVRVVEGQPRPAEGSDADLILRAIADYSRPLGTDLVVDGGWGTVPLPSRHN